MYGQSPWRQEIALVIVSLIALAILGSMVDIALWMVCFGLAAWLVWYIMQVKQVLLWLDRSIKKLPHDTPGLWGYVYYRLLLQDKKSKSRKKRIRSILKEFSSSTRAMPDATVVLNKRYEIQWINEAASRMLGLKRNDNGRLITDLLRQPDFRKWLNGPKIEENFVFPSPMDQRVVLLVRAVPYGKQQYLLVARDITERKRLDQMRQDFIANASHELRTPLSVLQGSLEMLETKLQGNAEVEKPLLWMQRQSERMQSILQDLLTLARLEAYDRARDDVETVEVDTLLGTIVEDARLLGEKKGGHKWQANIQEGLWIRGNTEHVRILLSNLVFNAVRYTPAGGSIYVSWQRRPGGARFEVQDTGPGIPIQHIPRLTERFYRVDIGRSRDEGGTGLGLAIVKHILDIYDSKLDVRSQLGRGSTFSFYLGPDRITDQPTEYRQQLQERSGHLSSSASP